MKTYKVVEKEGKFRIECKNKKSGSRYLVWDENKIVLEFETREEAQKRLLEGWDRKPATSSAVVQA